MNKARKGRDSAGRQVAVTALRDRLAEWEEEAGEELIAEALARFDGYSERNAKLIAMQCPDAADVDGFRAWIGRGRCVRRGEHGIAILAPAGTGAGGGGGGDEAGPADGKERAEGEGGGSGRRFFKITYVFDVRQTDPLPGSEDGEPVESCDVVERPSVITSSFRRLLGLPAAAGE